MNHPNRITPVIAGTAVMTFIQVIPLLNLLNLLCCSGILLGGFAGVYIYNRQIQNLSLKLEYKDGGMIGLLSGLLSAILVSGFTVLFSMFSDINPISEFYPVLDQLGISLSPEIEQVFSKLSNEYTEYGFSPTLSIITLVSNIILYPLFGTLGAFIAVAVFQKKSV